MREKPAQILLVDDESAVLSALRRTLRRENYQLHFASNAAEALEFLRVQRVDLLISDHLMPKMTGLELLKRCRLLYPEMGRVILTGQAEMETVIEAINHGEVLRFLRKPWDDDDLKLTIHLTVEHVRLAQENQRLLKLLESQAQQIKTLEIEHPGVTSVQRDESGAILIPDEDPGLEL